MITIYKNDGTVRLTLEGFNEGSLLHRELMSDHYVSLPFSLGNPVYFRIGDYVDIERFGRFELTNNYIPKYNQKTGGYDYTLRFDAYYIKWKNKKCRYLPELSASETSFRLTATIAVHLNVILSGINALGDVDSSYKYYGQDFIYRLVGFPSGMVNTAKFVEYSNLDFISALNNLASVFGCEYWIEENVIFFGKCLIDGTPIDFELDVNVLDMSGKDSSGDYATRIIAFGSTRNLPNDYRQNSGEVTINGIAEKRLMLPSSTCPNGYVQDDDVSNEQEAIEEVVIFDDIYPKTDCVVESVTTYTDTYTDPYSGETVTHTFYRVTDGSDLHFSTAYILENESLRMIFQSGSMNGMEFECRYDDNEQYYEIIVNETYGRKLPDTELHPSVNDRFVLVGWDVSKISSLGLIDIAEENLRQAVLVKIEEMKVDSSTYTCKMMSDWYSDKMDEDGFICYNLGQQVTLINETYFVTGRTSRIIGYELKLDILYDEPIYIVGQSLEYSRSQSVQKQIDSIVANSSVSLENRNWEGDALKTITRIVQNSDGSLNVSFENIQFADIGKSGLVSRENQFLSGDKTFEGNVHGMQGVSAKGIVDLSMSAAGGGGGGTTDHAELDNLDYANSGHTGFQKEITESNPLSYNLLTDTPDIPDPQIQSDWDQVDDTAKDYIKNKPALFNGKEAFIEWGGRNIKNGVSFGDSLADTLFYGNRLAFSKPDFITIEYSTDGGSSWTPYGATNAQKTNLVSRYHASEFYIGRKESGATGQDKLRITIEASRFNPYVANVYFLMNKLLIRLSTGGTSGSKVEVETKGTQSDSYTSHGMFDVEGWPEWNSIDMDALLSGDERNFGDYEGGPSIRNHTQSMRLTFSVTSAQSDGSLYVTNVFLYGDSPYEGSQSQMSKTGHIYSYESDQSVEFPADVAANGNMKADNVYAENNIYVKYGGLDREVYTSGNANNTSTDWAADELTVNDVVINGNEGGSNKIISVKNDNDVITINRPTYYASIRNALSFKWYTTDWQIGNIRNSGTGTSGFGITKDNNWLVFRVNVENNEEKAWIGNNIVYHAGNIGSVLADKQDKIDAGAHNLPIYVSNGVADEIDSLSVPGNIQSTNGGVSAKGIADLSMSAGGGGTDDHSQLINRDYADQHPISAITGLSDALNGKVDKVIGKGLSTNDYTNTDKNKVANIPADLTAVLAGKQDKIGTAGNHSLPVYFYNSQAEYIDSLSVPGNIQSTNGGVSAKGIADLSMSGGGGSGVSDFDDLNGRPKYGNVTMSSDTNIPAVPTKTSQLNNDIGFLTQHQSLDGYVNDMQADDTLSTFDDSSTIAIRKTGKTLFTRTAFKLWEYIKGKADSIYKPKQSAVDVSFGAIQTISELTQDASGVVSVVKQALPPATLSQSGLVSTTSQYFAGDKTFNGNVNGMLGVSAKGIVDLANSTPAARGAVWGEMTGTIGPTQITALNNGLSQSNGSSTLFYHKYGNHVCLRGYYQFASTSSSGAETESAVLFATGFIPANNVMYYTPVLFSGAIYIARITLKTTGKIGIILYDYSGNPVSKSYVTVYFGGVTYQTNN